MTIRTSWMLAVALASCASAPEPPSTERARSDRSLEVALEALRRGGLVLVMRHAESPEGQTAPAGLSSGCTLGEGRGLDAVGFYQARALGEVLEAARVPILRAYTSPMCRAWDTAALAVPGTPVLVHPSQTSTEPEAVAAFKAQLIEALAAHPGQNLLMANHSNIAPLYGALPYGEEALVPSGTVYVVDPATWTAISRLRVASEIGPRRVVAE